MTIQFLKDHTMPDGKRHASGAVALLDDALARELIKAGIAKERAPVKPTEQKEAASTPVDPPSTRVDEEEEKK